MGSSSSHGMYVTLSIIPNHEIQRQREKKARGEFPAPPKSLARRWHTPMWITPPAGSQSHGNALTVCESQDSPLQRTPESAGRLIQLRKQLAPLAMGEKIRYLGDGGGLLSVKGRADGGVGSQSDLMPRTYKI